MKRNTEALWLSADDSMEKLYASGEGQVFLHSMQWLDSPSDSLKTLGALAIGNFARRGLYILALSLLIFFHSWHIDLLLFLLLWVLTYLYIHADLVFDMP